MKSLALITLVISTNTLAHFWDESKGKHVKVYTPKQETRLSLSELIDECSVGTEYEEEEGIPLNGISIDTVEVYGFDGHDEWFYDKETDQVSLNIGGVIFIEPEELDTVVYTGFRDHADVYLVMDERGEHHIIECYHLPRYHDE
jgi:hypothetical protein